MHQYVSLPRERVELICQHMDFDGLNII